MSYRRNRKSGHPSVVGWVAAAAGALVALGGCDRSEATFAPPPPPDVTVMEAERSEVTPTLRLTGRVEAEEKVQIRARVGGFLRERRFEPGDQVEAGQVLFVIEQEPFAAAVNAAEANLAQAEAARGLAEVLVQRTQRAFDREAVNDLELLRSKAELDQAAAAVLAAESALEQAKLDYGYTSVVSPLAGRVSDAEVDLGNLVGGSDATLLARVIDDDIVFVYFTVTERDLIEFFRDGGRPRGGSRRGETPVTVILADGAAYEHPGLIDYADPEVDPATGTLRLRAKVPNPTGRLFPGMFVRVIVPKGIEQRVLIPEEALQRDLAGAYVLTVDAENTVARRGIEVGQSIDGRRIVISGLEAGERVIVNGFLRARPGAKVSPREQAAPASGGDGEAP